MDQYLTSIYYDAKHPASFSSPTKLYKTVTAEGTRYYSYQQIKHWLSKQEPYTLHKPVNGQFRQMVNLILNFPKSIQMNNLYLFENLIM